MGRVWYRYTHLLNLRRLRSSSHVATRGFKKRSHMSLGSPKSSMLLPGVEGMAEREKKKKKSRWSVANLERVDDLLAVL